MNYFNLAKFKFLLIFFFTLQAFNPAFSSSLTHQVGKNRLTITLDPADRCNYNQRIKSIALHYTVLGENDSRTVLKQGGVSSHFLIPKEAKSKGTDLWQLVAIKDRAWHAGKSYWQTRTNLDDTSVGIEIVNYGYGLVQDSGKTLWPYQVENQIKQMLIQEIKKDKNFYHLLVNNNLLNAFLQDMMRDLVPPRNCLTYKKYILQSYIKKYRAITNNLREKNDPFLNIKLNDLYGLEQQGKLVWDDFTSHQRTALASLLKKLTKELEVKDKNNNICVQIKPTAIVGHSDIAPNRKSDPGPRFPWKYLAEQGIGAWPDEQAVNSILKKLSKNKKINITWLQDNLRLYGYDIQTTKILDQQSKDVIRAFQWHFEPDNASGIPSLKTVALLEALIKKYPPEENQQIIHPRQNDFSIKLKRAFNDGWKDLKTYFLNKDQRDIEKKVSLLF
ncbi:N-acetylmuramoyl-L-alanine amidase [Rickettsiella endosymbiont of Miltochrista miniata]|uniref:N-acetylmuramoyl-L-alanine amidase n=1 Tax=Rickettsiella endosymbiont of Miltochrista miniata TaxID=3066239 RepID=UPI00313C1C67